MNVQTYGAQKVYISDSPVVDDSMEYRYISTDADEERNYSVNDLDGNLYGEESVPEEEGRRQTGHAFDPTEQALRDDEELAQEAAYQRELQERFLKTSAPQQRNESHLKNITIEDGEEVVGGSEALDYEITDWKNPPTNPFKDVGSTPPKIPSKKGQDAKTGVNKPASHPEPYLMQQPRSQVPPGTESVLRDVTSTQNEQRLMLGPESISGITERLNPSNGPPVAEDKRGDNWASDPGYGPAFNLERDGYFNYEEYSPIRQGYPPNQNEPQGYISQREEPRYANHLPRQVYYANPNTERADVPHSSAVPHQGDPAIYHGEDMYRAWPYEQSQTDAQIYQSEDPYYDESYPGPYPTSYHGQHPVAYPGKHPAAYPGSHGLDAKYNNELGVRAIRENESSDVAAINEPAPRIVEKILRTIPPKPQRLPANYVEKNKERVVGRGSAKPGYTDRLLQKRVEQEALKEWAPGMVVPRKKAASADDVNSLRAIESQAEGQLSTAEDVWKQRSKDLAMAKQTKAAAAGAKNVNKAMADASSMHRFPSEGYLDKSKMPAQDRRLNPQITYQKVAGWPEQQRVKLDINLNARQQLGQYEQAQYSPQPRAARAAGAAYALEDAHGYASPQHGKGLRDSWYSHERVAGPQMYNQTYVSQLHDGVLEYGSTQPYGGAPYGAAQQPPGATQFTGSYSGGYHHHSRTQDYTANPHHQVPTSHIFPQVQFQHQPAYMHAAGYSQHQKENHPVYDYSGYAQPYRKLELENGAIGYQDVELPSPRRPSLPLLNPYTTVPPIHSPVHSLNNQDLGSYVRTFQTQKEKAALAAERGPAYKAYTMKDYKKLTLEYKLGGLGPSQDPEELRIKNEKRLKQLQYAKEVMEMEKNKPHVAKPSREHNSDAVEFSKAHQLAAEYAKTVPKPKVVSKRVDVTSPTSSASKEQSNPVVPALQPVNTANHTVKPALQKAPNSSNKSLLKANTIGNQPGLTPLSQLNQDGIEDLQRRHQEERRAVAEIRVKMQKAV